MGRGVIYINCCSFDLYIFITYTVSLKKQKSFFGVTELNAPKLKNYDVHIFNKYDSKLAKVFIKVRVVNIGCICKKILLSTKSNTCLFNNNFIVLNIEIRVTIKVKSTVQGCPK